VIVQAAFRLHSDSEGGLGVRQRCVAIVRRTQYDRLSQQQLSFFVTI